MPAGKFSTLNEIKYFPLGTLPKSEIVFPREFIVHIFGEWIGVIAERSICTSWTAGEG